MDGQFFVPRKVVRNGTNIEFRGDVITQGSISVEASSAPDDDEPKFIGPGEKPKIKPIDLGSLQWVMPPRPVGGTEGIRNWENMKSAAQAMGFEITSGDDIRFP